MNIKSLLAALVVSLSLAAPGLAGLFEDWKAAYDRGNYAKAAEQGHPNAQFILGLMYERGIDVPQDYVEAHKWINLAAAQEFIRQEGAVKAREMVARKMTPAQIAEAQRLAREWKPKK